MHVKVTCNYCGFVETSFFLSKAHIEEAVCSKCSDATLKIENLKESKVDYYADSPPFEDKHVIKI